MPPRNPQETSPGSHGDRVLSVSGKKRCSHCKEELGKKKLYKKNYKRNIDRCSLLRKLYYSNGVYIELSDLFGCQSDDSLVGYENEAEKLLDVNVGIETQYITLEQ